MEYDQAKQRAAGIKLAEAAGATATAKLIADPEACFPQIMASAASEVGDAKLVELLKTAPGGWGRMARDVLPDLGADGAALAAADPNAANYGDSISNIQLFQGAPVSGIARCNDGNDQRFLNKNDIYNFNPADFGVAPGGAVQFYFGIEDDAFIKLAAAPGTFVFDPSSPKTAYFASWGPAGTQQFALQNGPHD